jgi:peptidyl-prolyl cis-trans isomerase D
MLGVLRRKKNSPIIAFLLGLIIIVFVAFFGNSWQNCANQRLFAARVNGQTISDPEYASVYAQAFRNMQNQDQKFDREKAKREKLRENVLNYMIHEVILTQDAEKRGLAVDKSALKDAITANPNFQTDGHFDKSLYERVLNQAQLPDYRFEARLKQELLSQKLDDVVQRSIGVSESEAKEAYQQDKRRVNLEFVMIKNQPYEARVGAVAQPDVDEWLKKPGSEEEVKKFYTKHMSTRYNTPKQVCARHILVRAEKAMPPDLRKKAEERIAEAGAEIGKGVDFAEVAKKYSEDSTKDKGGDLGCFGPGQMVPQFEEAAFGLKVGEVSTRIETPFGFHLIKVTEIKPPVEKKLEDVKSEIAMEIVQTQKASDLAKKRATDINDAQKHAKSLEDALASTKGNDPAPLKADETAPFPKREFIPRIGPSKEISAAAWKLTMDKPVPDSPFQTESGWVVIRLKEKTDAADVDFDKDKKMLMLTLGYQKRNAVAKAWSEALRTKAKITVHPLALSYDDEARATARGRQPQQ